MMTDSREISTEVEGNGRAVAKSESASIVAMILDAARDPTVDAAKVETMANLAIKLQDREQESQFNRDLNAAIMEMPVITKDGRIIITKDGNTREQGRFARYEDIDRVVRPIAARHNIAYRFEIGESNGRITVRPILSHANGFTYRGDAMGMPADQSGGKNAVQAVGSTSQYGKRYTLCATFNISTEGVDDDGGARVATMPFEREQTVMFEAQEAFDAGNYSDFFGRQSPKDRAWLIRSGNHAKFGGQPVIENKPAEPPRSQPRQAQPPREDKPAAATRQAAPPAETKRTPAQMVDAYEASIQACETIDALAEIQHEPRTVKWIRELSASHPDLHKRVIEIDKAQMRKIDDRQAASPSMFPEDD